VRVRVGRTLHAVLVDVVEVVVIDLDDAALVVTLVVRAATLRLVLGERLATAIPPIGGSAAAQRHSGARGGLSVRTAALRADLGDGGRALLSSEGHLFGDEVGLP
jgi:hypothetical protein